MSITNFISRENAYKTIDRIEQLDYFQLYLDNHITEEEKEVLGGLLDKVVETITKDIKNFEQIVKLHNNNRYEIHSNSNN